MGKYNIKEDITVGDPGLVDWGISVAKGVNDLDTRVTALSNGELRGTGFPEGAVTASVGTYYTDGAGTNGAWRWLKVSGTGNTGWRVIFGDTGYRNITSLLTSAPTNPNGKFLIRRKNDYVTYQVFELDVPVGKMLSSVPAGFVPAVAQTLWTSGMSTKETPERIQIGPNSVNNSSGTAPAWRRTGEVTFMASSLTWPTTLPGTAA